VGSRDALVPKSPHPVVVDAGARAPIRRLGALVDLQVGIGLTTAAHRNFPFDRCRDVAPTPCVSGTLMSQLHDAGSVVARNATLSHCRDNAGCLATLPVWRTRYGDGNCGPDEAH
jgi:hypothetical protein